MLITELLMKSKHILNYDIVLVFLFPSPLFIFQVCQIRRHRFTERRAGFFFKSKWAVLGQPSD
jgi:hypothetical protein